MTRAIIRYSFGSSPQDVEARGAARSDLEAADFQHIGTGSFEGQGDRKKLIAGLKKALDDAEWAPTLDHVWIYVDEPER